MNPNTAIRDIMTPHPTTVRPDDTASCVRAIFEKNSFHHLPVVKPGEKLVGIISRTDYDKIIYIFSANARLSNIAPAMICAADFMTKYPMQLEPDDTVGLAADVFLANKFHALPVVEDGQLVGIVTAHDLLKFSFENVAEGLECEVYEE